MNDKTKATNDARMMTDRGARTEIAKDVLEEIIEELAALAFDQFRLSDLHDVEGFRAIRYYQQVLDDVGRRIEYRIETGKLQQDELIRLN